MRRLGVLLAALLFLAGCGGRDDTDWDTFAPAQEDRLVVYTSHPASVYDPVVKEFEERTGIWVQVETGETWELLEHLEEEQDEPKCDLIFGGGVDSLTARKELFAPYVSPLAEEIEPAFRCADGSWTPVSVLPVVLIYNPVLVRSNPPEGWENLLDPVWRGRIAFADPAASGTGFTALATLLQVLPDDSVLESFYRALGGQTLSGVSEVVDKVTNEVAEGSCTIGVTTEPAALEAIRAGRDLALVYPAEGTSAAADGAAVVSGCAHEENARRFIDFVLSEDVQRYLLQTCQRRSVRMELYAPADETAGLTLIDYDLEQAAGGREWILSVWRSLEEEP